MNETLKKAAELFLEKAVQGFDFLGEQIPDVLMQVVVYYRVMNTIWVLLGVALGIHGGQTG